MTHYNISRSENHLERFNSDFDGNRCLRGESAAVQGILDRCQFDRIGDVGIGRHVQQLAGQPVRSHFQT